MVTIIAFVSQKGGVGKSTLSRAVAREAAHAGLRTKIADLDTQQGTSIDWNRTGGITFRHPPTERRRAVETRSKHWDARLVALVVSTIVYFVLYPQDLTTLVGPVETVFSVSNVISPWLYGLIGVVVLSWTMVRVWGGKPKNAVDHANPP
jgi:AAA domain